MLTQRFFSQVYPRIVWSPSFACTTEDLSTKIDFDRFVVSAESTLILEGEGIRVKSLSLRGTLIVRASAGARVTIHGLEVTNGGWEWRALEEAEEASEEERMRGFRVVKHEARVIEFSGPGEHTITQ